MNLIDLVIAWVMLVLTQVPEDRPQVVRIGHATALLGQEVQADAANRLVAVPTKPSSCRDDPKRCRGPPETPEGRA